MLFSASGLAGSIVGSCPSCQIAAGRGGGLVARSRWSRSGGGLPPWTQSGSTGCSCAHPRGWQRSRAGSADGCGRSCRAPRPPVIFVYSSSLRAPSRAGLGDLRSSCVSRLGIVASHDAPRSGRLRRWPALSSCRRSRATMRIKLQLRELIRADVRALVLPEAIEEDRPLASTKRDQHTIAVALALASARHALLDHLATQIGADQALSGIIERGAEHGVGDARSRR